MGRCWWWVRNLWRMGMVWTIVLVFAYVRLFFRIVFRRASIYPRSAPTSHSARACIVTGASSGIGKATAESLALEGYHVILAGRSLPALTKAVKEIKQNHKEDLFLYAMELDLCSVNSIVAFVKSVENWLSTQALPVSLQLLVNNAGIFARSRRYTPDGYDCMIMTNYLAPFMLTRLLLPKLHKSSARIVNVSSFTHRAARKMDSEIWRTLVRSKPQESGKPYEMASMYEASKLCVLLFTYELHERYNLEQRLRISVMAADPGIVQTGILRELPWWLVQFTFFILKGIFLLQTPDCGARAVVDACLAPTEVSGKYFFGGNGFTLPSATLSYDDKLARRLWDLSNEAYEVAIDCKDKILAGV